MKLRTFLASVSACAIALSAVAMTASAADALMSKTGNTESAKNYTIDFTGIDGTAVDKIVAEITVDSAFVNGCIGYNLDGNWTTANQETSATSGEWVVEGLAGGLGAEPYAEIQFWWVNPMYNEDGSEGDAGTASLMSVTLYDASGNVLSASGSTTDAPADDNDDTATTTTTTAGSSNTGDAGIALAVAGLAVAGAAAYVARKKD